MPLLYVFLLIPDKIKKYDTLYLYNKILDYRNFETLPLEK